MKKLFIIVALFIVNQSNAYRECTIDADCSYEQPGHEAQICIGATAEKRGRCQAKCKVDADCPENKYCNTQNEGREHCALRPIIPHNNNHDINF